MGGGVLEVNVHTALFGLLTALVSLSRGHRHSKQTLPSSGGKPHYTNVSTQEEEQRGAWLMSSSPQTSLHLICEPGDSPRGIFSLTLISHGVKRSPVTGDKRENNCCMKKCFRRSKKDSALTLIRLE